MTCSYCGNKAESIFIPIEPDKPSIKFCDDPVCLEKYERLELPTQGS